MMERLPKVAGAGPLADYAVGQRVMTVEGYPGTVTDVLEGPGDLTTVMVDLDNGMGGGEYAEGELQPLNQTDSSRIDASVEHTAVDDYPELGSILTDRLPPQITTRTASKTATSDEFRDWDDAAREDMGGEEYLDPPYDEDVALAREAASSNFEALMGSRFTTKQLARFALTMWHANGSGPLWNMIHHSQQQAEDYYGSIDEDQLREEAAEVLDRGGITVAMLNHRTSSKEAPDPFVREAASIPPIPDHLIPGQFSQYPQSGPDGISYFRGEINDQWYVDCLLYRKDGELVGVLNHYPMDMGPERKGNVLVLVHPEHRREGIGRALWEEAKKRWNVVASGQDQTPMGRDFLRSVGLYLPPVPPSEQRASTTDLPASQKAGYDEGFAHGKEGITRDPSQPDDEDFRVGYDIGWAEGVTVAREPANSWDIDDLGKDQTADMPPATLPTQNSQMLSMVDRLAEMERRGAPLVPTATSFQHEGGLFDGVTEWLNDNSSPGSPYSYDWCRFRRSSHCWLPKGLNEAASKQAGYAVWIPQDRGVCWRPKWDQQKKCPTGEPGPHSGPEGYTDATIPWEEGGQRNGVPTTRWADPSRYSSLHTAGPVEPHEFVPMPPANTVCEVCDHWRYDSLAHPGEKPMQVAAAFEFTAAWKDIREKAKRIRTEGGVRIVSVVDNVMVAHVKGDHGVYETEIVSYPGKRNAAAWHCGCKWASYSWGRSGPWKRYEGRMCSHALALQYEAQSRGAHGRTLTLDEKQPAWMDGKHVFRPGDYDKNKQRYSSRRTDLHPVHEQTDDVAPVTLLAQSMLHEGTRYADIRKMLLSLGVDRPADIVRTARKRAQKEAFVGRVDGEFVNIDIDGDGFHDETGEPIDPSRIEYPKWHPSLGMDPDEQKVLTLGSKDQTVPPSEHGDPRMQDKGVSVSKTKDGKYYVHTHRARGKYWDSVADIPDSEIEYIRSTGAREGDADPFSREGAVNLRDLPKPLGETPIPSGAIRCYHYTGEADAESIARSGLLSRYARGDGGMGYGNEPSAGIWAATGRPATTEGMKGAKDGQAIIEFWIKPEQISQQAEYPPSGTNPVSWGQGYHHIILRGDLSPNQIVAIHLPWHRHARYLLENYPTTWREEFGDEIDSFDADYRKAFDWLSKHASKTAAKWPPAVLYHYTSEIYLPAILASGNLRLTSSNIDIDGSGPEVVWLTTTVDPGGNGLDGGFGKGDVRFRIEPDPRHTFHWPTWAFEQGISPIWYDALDSVGGNGSENWWVSTEPIPMDRVLSIEVNGVPYRTGAKKGDGPTVSGLVLKAADTGRVLMLQRSMDDDKASGKWEWPGGHHEDGDLTSLHAAIREWQEEVGQPLPEGGYVAHTWTSPDGIYQGHLLVIPSEKDLILHEGRIMENPDDPNSECCEQVAWWDPEDARKNPALREECKGTPWSVLKSASLSTNGAYYTEDDMRQAAAEVLAGTGLTAEEMLAQIVAEQDGLSTTAVSEDFRAAARAMLEMARRNEPSTTEMLSVLALEYGGDMVGLNFRLKSEESLLRKMLSRAHEHGGDAGMTAANVSDSLRYTMMFSSSRYTQGVKAVLNDLENAGYRTRVKNYWEKGDAYQGINVAMMTPKGHPFELQFHTPESLAVKDQTHRLYEDWRTNPDPQVREELSKEMIGLTDKVPVPSGILSVPELKRMPLASVGAAGDGWLINGKPYSDGVWIEVEPDLWYRGAAPGEIPSRMVVRREGDKWAWQAQVLTFIGAPHEDTGWQNPGAPKGTAKTLEQAQERAEKSLAKDHEFYQRYDERMKARLESVGSADGPVVYVKRKDHLWTWQCPHCGETQPGRGYRDETNTRELAEAHAMWCYDLGWDDQPVIKEASLQTEAASGEWQSIPGLTFMHRGRQMIARSPECDEVSELAGKVFWYRDGEIGYVVVNKRYRRMGLATELLRRAREIEPNIHHSDKLTDDGRAWSQAVSSLRVTADEDQCPFDASDSLMQGGLYVCENGHAWHPDEPAAKAFHEGPGELQPVESSQFGQFAEIPALMLSHNPAPKEGSKMDIPDEFGSLFDDALNGTRRTAAEQRQVLSEWGFDPSYQQDSFGMAGPNTPYWEDVPGQGVDDDPEAALPITYGDEDEADKVASLLASQLGSPHPTFNESRRFVGSSHLAGFPLCAKGCMQTLSADQPMVNTLEGLAHAQCPTTASVRPSQTPTSGPRSYRTERAGGAARPQESEEARGRRLLAYADAIARGEAPEGPNPFEHLLASQQDNEIAAGAAQFLAKARPGGLQAEALKSYSPVERQQIIDEGEAEGVVATNLDRLDIKGTHYEAMEASSSRVTPEDEDLWMLDGDPNGME